MSKQKMQKIICIEANISKKKNDQKSYQKNNEKRRV